MRDIDFQAIKMTMQSKQERDKMSFNEGQHILQDIDIITRFHFPLTNDILRVTDISSGSENKFNWHLEWRKAYRFGVFFKKETLLQICRFKKISKNCQSSMKNAVILFTVTFSPINIAYKNWQKPWQFFLVTQARYCNFKSPADN